MPSSLSELQRMARACGVQTAYYDVNQRRQVARPESLLAVLCALGVVSESLRDQSKSLERERQARLTRRIEPVIVAWDNQPPKFEIRLPVHQCDARLICTVEMEDGSLQRAEHRLDQVAPAKRVETQNGRYHVKQVKLSNALPWGYHRLVVEAQGDGSQFEAMIISAPCKAYPSAQNEESGQRWAAFLPLYSLQTENGWGAGTYADLASFATWIGERGGTAAATLPLLPAFLDSPFDPSPYAPVSRLFWNEFYVDVRHIPELEGCPQAKRVLQSEATQSEIDELRSGDLVDYRRIMSLKRRILEPLSEWLFERKDRRFEQLMKDTQNRTSLVDYACFRAAHEKQGCPWSRWPARMRDGRLESADYDVKTQRYYHYAQWIASQQVAALAGRASEAGVGLYLDVPLGVHPHGYDVWRNRDTFVAGVTAGAPPDVVFTKGQNWGFSPMHPEALRRQRYRYVIELVRHHLQHARQLRIDHVMSLHRLFWIPAGMEPADGVYVQYRADELYAILSLESHRHRTAIVGENLGTVPKYVNSTMNRHNIRRMFVVQYELDANSDALPGRVPLRSISSLNTHDMPTFAGFWDGEDIRDRQKLGLLDEVAAERERRAREQLKHRLIEDLRDRGLLDDDEPQAQQAMQACTEYLAASPAEMLVVNVEDLWLERLPQNIPGTSEERPNWRRKAQYCFEELREMPAVVETLKRVDRLRKQGGRAASRQDRKARP